MGTAWGNVAYFPAESVGAGEQSAPDPHGRDVFRTAAHPRPRLVSSRMILLHIQYPLSLRQSTNCSPPVLSNSPPASALSLPFRVPQRGSGCLKSNLYPLHHTERRLVVRRL